MALITSKSRVKPTFSAGKRQGEAKKTRQEEVDDICVVGYACKLFRDDARARDIDRGTHLIPWMGDQSLKIDRYDGRGHLHDLRDFDQHGWNEESQLSAEAARIEAICDEERYMALHTDLLEEQNRQEEELKRLNEAITGDKGYGSVAFSYGTGDEDYDPMQPTEDESEAAQKKLLSLENQPPPSYQDEDSNPAAVLEEPFIAPPELKLPPGMGQPETLKMHIIIEKTAMFVSNQGAQMEIIVKTKQANNPQFDFLHFEHYLNPYYKHLVAAIKSKLYIPIVLRQPEPEKKKQGEIGSRRSSNSNTSIQSDDEDDEMEGSGYLHPSLFATPRPKPPPVQMQPLPPPGAIHPDHIPPPGSLGPGHHHQGPPGQVPPGQGGLYPGMDPSQQQLMAYYEGEPVTTTTAHHHHHPHHPHHHHHHLPPMLVPPPPPPDHANAGAPPVPLSHPMGALPPPGYLPGDPLTGPPPPPVLPPHHPGHHPGLVAPPPLLEGPPGPQPQGPLPGAPTSILGPPLISQEMPMPPAGDESAIEPPPPQIVPPPPDIQPVIDKLAKYVAKNGDDFEASVRAKRDPRFEFLVPWHSYNAYYLAKKRMFIQELSQEPNQGDRDAGAMTDKSKKVPVRFPIKPKRAEERTLERKSALPVESSSDSDNDTSESSTSGTNEKGAVGGGWPGGTAPPSHGAYSGARAAASPMDYDDGSDRQQHGSLDTQGGRMQGGGDGDAEMEEEEAAAAFGYYGDEDTSGMGVDERSGLDSRDVRKTGGNQQRLEDRLALAARRKLASASQERSVQVERRKKLALFLSQVKDRPQAAAAAQEGGFSDSERELSGRVVEERDRSRSSSRPRSPSSHRSTPPPRGGQGEGRGSKKGPSVPKSYQTAVNREALERERRRRRHSRSRSPSPRKMKRKSPPPLPASIGSSAIIGRSSSASPVAIDMFQDRESSVSSPSSDSSSSKTGSQGALQPVGLETKTETKGGSSELRAKIRAMLAATLKDP